MPIRWDIDHTQRLISAAVTGAIERADMDRYLVEVVAAGGGRYATLFDVRAASLELHTKDLLAISGSVRNGRSARRAGAIALIVASDAAADMADYFAKHTNAERPCRVFTCLEDASAWLSECSHARPALC